MITKTIIAMLCLALPLGVFIWLAMHLETSQQKKREAQRIKDEQYRKVLASAKLSERKERQQKASGGHVPTQLSLAKEHELVNAREAIKWYTLAADEDNDIAQRALARLCREDIDDPAGCAKSDYWQAVVDAKSGNVEQQFALGLHFHEGSGVAQDEARALEHIEAAACARHVPALLFLARHFEESDLSRSLMWWQRAAIEGDVQAQKRIALGYLQGDEADADRAIYWLERAAALGDKDAQYLAGRLQFGDDPIRAAIAYTWFSIATANGHLEARQARDETVSFVGIESILNVQAVTKTVFQSIVSDDEDVLTPTDMLDQVYTRTGYRPSQDDLSLLYDEDIDHWQSDIAPAPTLPNTTNSVASSDNLDRLLSEFAGQDLDKNSYQAANWSATSFSSVNGC